MSKNPYNLIFGTLVPQTVTEMLHVQDDRCL